jgi:carbonic anhydrase
MPTNRLISAAFSIVCLVFGACSTDSKTENITPTSETLLPASKHVMTKAEQDSLTPDQVLQEFIQGNERFNTGSLTQRDHSEEIRKAATGVTKHYLPNQK